MRRGVVASSPAVVWLVVVLALTVVTSACGARGSTANEVASPRSREGTVTCGGCHEAAVREWDGSMHHASFSSPDFQASYREEPLAFCVACHAPRRPALGVELGNAHGIDCASCHPGVEAHERARLGSARAGEAVPPRTVACATCHELSSVGSATLLQSTASEHAASPFRSVSCASCHMPRDAHGHSSHAFRVSRDPSVIRRALVVRDVGLRPEGASFTLASVGVGHKFPTGDIFRALRVRAWVEDERGRIVGETSTELHRDWDAHRRSFGRREVEPETDTRLDDHGRTFVVGLAERSLGAAALRLQVDYVRGFEARAGELSAFATLTVLDETYALGH